MSLSVSCLIDGINYAVESIFSISCRVHGCVAFGNEGIQIGHHLSSEFAKSDRQRSPVSLLLESGELMLQGLLERSDRLRLVKGFGVKTVGDSLQVIQSIKGWSNISFESSFAILKSSFVSLEFLQSLVLDEARHSSSNNCQEASLHVFEASSLLFNLSCLSVDIRL